MSRWGKSGVLGLVVVVATAALAGAQGNEPVVERPRTIAPAAGSGSGSRGHGPASSDRAPASGVAAARAQSVRAAPVNSQPIAFRSYVDDGYTIVVVQPDGSARREVAKGSTPRWAPDGSVLAFVRGLPLPGVFVVAADGTGERQLVHDLADQIDWSPTGKEIAFSASRPSGARPTYSLPSIGMMRDVGVVTVSHPPVARPITVGPHASEYLPTWSRDGERLAFVASGLFNGLYVANRDGTGQQRTVTPVGWGLIPEWGPGEHIVSSADGGVYLSTPHHPEAVQLWAGDVSGGPRWSPTADAVLFPVSRDPNGPLMVVALRTDGTVLFERPGYAADWSPDGNHVAICAPEGLVRVTRHGTDAQLITPGYCDEVDW